MKPRNFYLFVGLLAVWMAWATGLPALLLAIVGHDDYSVSVFPVWTPEVHVDSLGVNERTAAATARDVVISRGYRARLGDRIEETMGGFHWHGAVPSMVSVRLRDGGQVRFRMDVGSSFAEYEAGATRAANGDPILEREPARSARDAR